MLAYILPPKHTLAQKGGVSFLESGTHRRNSGFNQLIERIEQVALCSQTSILLMGR